MKKIHHVAHVICPAITLFCSLAVDITTMYLENTISLIFLYLSTQFYLNWYLTFNINRKVVIPFTMATCRESGGTCSKFWYCEKCKLYTRRPAQHCSLCRKCYYYRDHHCFFLGCCIMRQNMGNFIIVCLYASLACMYAIFTVGPYLYNYFLKTDSSKLSIHYFALNFFFPITLAKYLIMDNESIIVFLVVLFNVSISVSCFTLFYGVWKLYSCLSGRQRYYPNGPKSQDVYEIFGSYGFLNFLFPFNGFLHSKNIDERYELKYV